MTDNINTIAEAKALIDRIKECNDEIEIITKQTKNYLDSLEYLDEQKRAETEDVKELQRETKTFWNRLLDKVFKFNRGGNDSDREK